MALSNMGLLGMAGAMLKPGGGLSDGFTAYGQGLAQDQQLQAQQARTRLLQQQMGQQQQEFDLKRQQAEQQRQIDQQMRSLMGGMNLSPAEQAYAQADPTAALKLLLERQKPKDPIKLGSGDVLLDPATNKPLFRNEKPVDWNQLIVQGPDGKPMVNQMLLDAQLKKAAAGRTQVNVNTAENSFMKGIGAETAKSIGAMGDAARGAVSSIDTTRRIAEALNAGAVNAGPGATLEQFADQIAVKLGVAGKDQKERALNTRQLIQGLAQLELDAAQQMKGQGQITEAERAILRRAASGDIASMTAPELRLLAQITDRTARVRIQRYNQSIESLKTNPNMKGVTPMLGVDMPEVVDFSDPAAAPATPAGSSDIDALVRKYAKPR